MALDFVQRIHITRVTHGFIPVAFKQQRRISPVFAAHADAKRAAVTGIDRVCRFQTKEKSMPV